ncbi:MAG: UDP-N-acetylmuramoyl-L-alanine--D-glutamate ligase [Gemmatimonadales bacterium]|nr:UDP-N-acetylmuramoyl-L-alanine--D-glutamate ligase [Gemmatimonadales bacterium]MBP6569992.1 UDP-N-acetylmuramoyl-L-alanine--D-glutamate ligase [Gemmatimonadales bacterium]MBP7621424.1 UDP-N-acetylmuramoyl-L-alanine--D-glutamate ligase [Gemmatimonadales bacterium]
MSRFTTWQADGREVAVAGLARSGAAAARLLRARGIPVYLSDGGAGEKVLAVAAELRALNDPQLHVQAGAHDLARIGRSAALILSPGIPPTAAVVRAALDVGVPVLAEAQLGLDALAGVPYIAVTGTNGKTTTTALLEHLMQAAGRHAVAAGNIGLPLSDVARGDTQPAWLAVELSSFQLHDCPDLMPAVGILTNLAPDHLDRYPDLAAYYADKARLFARASGTSCWVTNLDDPESRRMIAAVPGRHLAFSVAPGVRADAWYDRGTDQLMLAGAPLLPREALPLLGDHNVANVLAAALALHATGIGHAALADGIRSFRPMAHRLEPVREVDGVLWVNDSKATNVASTVVAVEAMQRPFVLLLGGRHKGEPYTALRKPLAAHGVAVVAYGEAAGLIQADLGADIRVVPVGDFAEVMATARALAPRGGAVLLSPACSSYDMFDHYEHRGGTFRQIVESW